MEERVDDKQSVSLLIAQFLPPFFFDRDVSKVTSFEDVFYECKDFNDDISDWDVSSATNMAGMCK